MIANSAELHRIKGTRPAVELAMESLGVEVELTEWFEATPHLPRGTFRAVLYVNENLTPEAPGAAQRYALHPATPSHRQR